MSSVYATEPATSGRVIFETTHGPIELQLWCRECPLTTKLFLQLCLDGYFTNMIFHRIVPNMCIQTGAIRKEPFQHSGFENKEYQNHVQAKEQLERRKYEIQSRLRFNHRGQVAMALSIEEDDNNIGQPLLQPQFFITLDEAPYLNGTHVLFGTVVGPTLFNVLRIGNMECNDNHEPIDLEYAPCITGVKIMEHPLLTELIPSSTSIVPWKAAAASTKQEILATKKNKKKRKGKKDLNVLSFGNEFEEEESDTTYSGILSSHDVIPNKTFKKDIDIEVMEQQNRIVDNSKSKTTKNERRTMTEKQIEKSTQDMDYNNAINEQMESTVATIRYEPTSKPPTIVVETRPMEKPSPPPPPPPKKVSSSIVEARLAKYKRGSAGTKQHREDDTMAKLMSFQSKVRQTVSDVKKVHRHDDDDGLATRMMMARQQHAPKIDETHESYHGQVLETENDLENWLGSTFTCKRHVDHESKEGLGGDGRNMDEYLVVDPKEEASSRRKIHGKGRGERRR